MASEIQSNNLRPQRMKAKNRPMGRVRTKYDASKRDIGADSRYPHSPLRQHIAKALSEHRLARV